MFQLRDSKSVLVNQISSFLPDMLKLGVILIGGRQKVVVKKIIAKLLRKFLKLV